MSSYKVQFTMPVDNPVDNVRKVVKKGGYLFEVPINLPDAHNLGLQDLFIAAERAMIRPVNPDAPSVSDGLHNLP